MTRSKTFLPRRRTEPAPFGPEALAKLATAYGKSPALVPHHLQDRALVSLPQLTVLSASLAKSQISVVRGDVAIDEVAPNFDPDEPIAAFVQGIERTCAIMTLGGLEGHRDYKQFVYDLLRPLRPVLRIHGAPPISPTGAVRLASPQAVSPFSLGTDHRVILVARGTASVFVYPSADQGATDPSAIEQLYTEDRPRDVMPYDPDYDDTATVFDLGEGDGLYLPPETPYWIDWGEALALAVEVSWETEESRLRADGYRMNAWLREKGFPQHASTKKWRMRAKAAAFRRFIRNRR